MDKRHVQRRASHRVFHGKFVRVRAYMFFAINHHFGELESLHSAHLLVDFKPIDAADKLLQECQGAQPHMANP